MDMQMITLSVGLLGLMLINITLGSIDAIIQGKFDKKKLFQGFLKSVLIIACVVGTYYIGVYNTDVVVIRVNEQDVNIVTALYLGILSGFISYAKQVLEKLRTFTVVKEVPTTKK